MTGSVMRLLFIGDIVGSPGVALVRRAVPLLRRAESLDLVVANAENAANGSGLTPTQYRQLRAAGVDAVTLGDHVYKKLEIESVL
ncbi:MAG TPA: YmdB family metallophosphoesterase, partial [Gemmataceae bacterium]|nr:YmdB family metallophosphoesterase [Gemmataceae bacterium]